MEFINFLLENWTYILIIFYVAEKVVKLTPFEWDDILVDGIKAILKKLASKNSTKPTTMAPEGEWTNVDEP